MQKRIFKSAGILGLVLALGGSWLGFKAKMGHTLQPRRLHNLKSDALDPSNALQTSSSRTEDSKRVTAADFKPKGIIGSQPAPEVMSAEERLGELVTLEDRVESEDMIKRLNDDSVTAQEREQFGFIFSRIAALKAGNLTQYAENLAQEVSRAETEQAVKVEAMNAFLSGRAK